MKCLIPISQETRNENSVKRASVLCDEIHILYLFDKNILDKMTSEAAYVLDSQTLRNLEDTIIESQRKEAEDILKAMEASVKKVALHFEVGEYFETLEKYTLKLMPDILMVDSFERMFLSLEGALWIDRGNDINSCIFAVQSVAKVKKLGRNFELVKEICQRLHCEIKIYSVSGEKEVLGTLKKLAPITSSPVGDLLCLQSFDHKHTKKHSTVLLFCS